MEIVRNYFTLLIMFSFFGCAQPSLVSIKSTPSAAVVKAVGVDGDIKELGETPLNISSFELFQNKDVLKIIIEKKDFLSEQILFVRPNYPADVRISSNLKRSENAAKDLGLQKLESLTTKLGRVQNNIYQKNYNEGLALLKELEREHSGLSILYDLQGNIAYLQGDFRQAERMYSQADEINPMNPDRAKILRRLKSLTGTAAEDTQ
jgi:tetratricopeptide (TPR) repeat protein